MAYSSINDAIKPETNTHFHNLLHAQLSAEDSRIVDNNDSAEESGESPLDFSIKRKFRGYDEVSGSDSLSSTASSLNDTMGHTEDRKSDNDVSVNIKNARALHESPSDRSLYCHYKQHKNEHLRHEQPSIHGRIGQNKTSGHLGGSNRALPDMLHDLQMGIANANMIANTFPAMAALMEHRQTISSPKCSFHFNPYPNDPISILLENRNLPHYLTSLTNFENSAIMRGLNLSADEVFSIYNQQLLELRERERHIETLKLTQEQHSIKTSTITTSSPSTPIRMSRVSVHISGKDNGGNSNITESILNAPFSSSHATTPPSPGQHSNISNCGSHISINSSSSHLPSAPSLTLGGRRRPKSLPDEQKDEAYWERRRKNNDAAKRSRDARRAKEDQIAIRAALLEQENLKLRVEIASLKTETAKLRCVLYNT